MGLIHSEQLINQKISFESLDIIFKKTLKDKELNEKDRIFLEQLSLTDYYSSLKIKSKKNKQIYPASQQNIKIINSFLPLKLEKDVFIQWIQLLYNINDDFLEECKQNNESFLESLGYSSIVKRFQNNLKLCYKQKSRPFLKLIARGVPPNLRTLIWTTIIDLDEGNESNVSNNEQEKKDLKTLISLGVDNKTKTQIQNDINRTFNKEEEKSPENIKILENLLIALNNLDEETGYCQGINFMIGFLLKVTKFNEIKTFHLARLILKKIKGYYTQHFPLLEYNLREFNRAFKHLYPKLYHHLKENNIPDELWVGKWIQTLFTVCMPYKETCRLWDSLIVYGVDFVIPLSLSILGFVEKKLLKLQDSADIIFFLKETLNPQNPIFIEYEDNDSNIENYVIPISEIISNAKKISRNSKLGPINGEEYSYRSSLDNRNLTQNSDLSTSMNSQSYRNTMNKIKAQKKEESSFSFNNSNISFMQKTSFPSHSSSDLSSSVNNISQEKFNQDSISPKIKKEPEENIKPGNSIKVTDKITVTLIAAKKEYRTKKIRQNAKNREELIPEDSFIGKHKSSIPKNRVTSVRIITNNNNPGKINYYDYKNVDEEGNNMGKCLNEFCGCDNRHLVPRCFTIHNKTYNK